MDTLSEEFPIKIEWSCELYISAWSSVVHIWIEARTQGQSVSDRAYRRDQLVINYPGKDTRAFYDNGDMQGF